MYLSCVLLGNMSKRLMQTGECGAELGYRFLVTDTASVVRLAGISSLLASANGGTGEYGANTNDFFVKSFMRASLFGPFFCLLDFFVLAARLRFLLRALCRAVAWFPLLLLLLPLLLHVFWLHFVKCAARVNI